MLIDCGANVACMSFATTQEFRDLKVSSGNEFVIGGWTPLHMAIRYGQISIFEASKHGGADWHKKDAYGTPPLHLCVKYKKVNRGYESKPVAVLNALLDAGEDIEEKVREWQETPLHTAARAGSVDCVVALLERGAVVDAKNSNPQTARMIATEAGSKKLVKILEDFEAQEGRAEK
jgi:ankyrin repeat protein